MTTSTPAPADLSRICQPPQATKARRQRWLLACEAMVNTRAAMAEAHPALVEAACFAHQIGAWFDPPQAGDRLVGRIAISPLGCSPEPGGIGWYRNDSQFEQILAAPDLLPDEAQRWLSVQAAWADHSSTDHILSSKPTSCQQAMPPGQGDVVPGAIFGLQRIAGLQVDHRRLLQEGLPRLLASCEQAALDVTIDDEARIMHQAWAGIIRAYQDCLDSFAQGAQDASLAADCRQCGRGSPQTFRQALQLIWLWDAGAGLLNHGRLDDSLAPYLKEGASHEIEAIADLSACWQLMALQQTVFNNRVIIGGRGRQFPVAADRVARCCLQATAFHDAIEPQLSLRIAEQQDPELLQQGLDILASGRTFPILYWDDNIIPAIMRSHHVDEQAAEQWLPYGCGEYTLRGTALATPNGITNAARILEEVLFDLPFGSRQAASHNTGPQFTGIEDLWQSYAERSRRYMAALAQWQRHTYTITNQDCRLLAPSLLMEDCMKRGRGLLDGGLRHLGGTMELYGMVDAGDAFAAIDQIIFRDGQAQINELRQALLDNFAGHEILRARLLRAPRYGNDNPLADHWTQRLHRLFCEACAEQAPANGLHHFLVVVINNWVNTVFGRFTLALPNGRLQGLPLTNGNCPQTGSDKNGPTALLRSLSGLSAPDAGAVQHLKLSAPWFSEKRQDLQALLTDYAAHGGKQLMITTCQADELQKAMQQPEHYGHLMVRVGGFSARFVDLPRDCQREICERSLY